MKIKWIHPESYEEHEIEIDDKLKSEKDFFNIVSDMVKNEYIKTIDEILWYQNEN